MAVLPRRLQLQLQLQLQVEEEEEEDRSVVAAALVQKRQEDLQRRRRRWWVRPWIQRRQLYGQYETLFAELDRESEGYYMPYLLLDRNTFADLLHRVAPRITKSETNTIPLEPGLKLVISLRSLATGNSYRSLAFSFRVAHNTIALFVPKVCKAIYESFKDELFIVPSSPDQWQRVASDFSQRWKFHHCCGALDGKHIEIKKPDKSGSNYFNYKGYFSLILLALVDADYKFIWCNTGGTGSASDAGVFNSSRLRQALENNTLGLQNFDPLPGDDRPVPYFMVGDDAFPLRTWMMKPYRQKGLSHNDRVFNYRLSRCRRVVENALGILAHRLRCLLTCHQLQPKNATVVVEACLTLHNLLRTRNPRAQANDVDREDETGNLIPGAWRAHVHLTDPKTVGGCHLTREGKIQRNYLSDYYNSDIGRLPWQVKIVEMTL